jgi:hypothetical protein
LQEYQWGKGKEEQNFEEKKKLAKSWKQIQ